MTQWELKPKEKLIKILKAFIQSIILGRKKSFSIIRSNHQKCSIEKGFLKISQNLHWLPLQTCLLIAFRRKWVKQKDIKNLLTPLAIKWKKIKNKHRPKLMKNFYCDSFPRKNWRNHSISSMRSSKTKGVQSCWNKYEREPVANVLENESFSLERL